MSSTIYVTRPADYRVRHRRRATHRVGLAAIWLGFGIVGTGAVL
jgi:hypothetical protein